MKSVIVAVALAAFAGLCSAQAGLPECAQKCVVKFTTGSNIGGCQSAAVACICSSPTFLGDIACCLSSACGAEDQQKATDYARNICELAGVTNLPKSVVCSSTATSGTTSATQVSNSSGSSSPVSSTGSVTPAPSVAATTTSAPATTSTPNAGVQNAAGVGAGFGMLALAALL